MFHRKLKLKKKNKNQLTIIRSITLTHYVLSINSIFAIQNTLNLIPLDNDFDYYKAILCGVIHHHIRISHNMTRLFLGFSTLNENIIHEI